MLKIIDMQKQIAVAISGHQPATFLAWSKMVIPSATTTNTMLFPSNVVGICHEKYRLSPAPDLAILDGGKIIGV